MQWPREDLKSVVPTPLRYVEAFERQPGLGSAQRPMHICIGYDEYSPGSMFNIENNKKVMALYMNFRELDCMADSCTWFTPLVVRARRADDVKGGWSAMLSWFLKHMLCGPHGLKTVGISFSYGNRDHLFFSVWPLPVKNDRRAGAVPIDATCALEHIKHVGARIGEASWNRRPWCLESVSTVARTDYDQFMFFVCGRLS